MLDILRINILENKSNKLKSKFFEIYELTGHQIPDWKLLSFNNFILWYSQVKERDKHNKDKLIEHANDLFDFFDINVQLLSETSDQEIKKLNLRLLEIERRFTSLLNIDYNKIKQDQKESIDKDWENKMRNIFNN